MDQPELFTEAALLATHPAVTTYLRGVHPEHLASFQTALARAARNRLTGIGAQQYTLPDGRQKFEEMDGDDLTQAMLEEVLDIQNYLAMLAIRLLAARNTLRTETT